MKILDAVVLVLYAEEKLFLVKRQNHLPVFPGYHSFPGGKVDKADGQGGKDPLMEALKREAMEEIGFDVGEAFEKKQVLHFCQLGVALTPPFNPYRFNTHFYFMELAQKREFQIDPQEIERGEWRSPQEWYDLYLAGDLLLVPPTLTLLQEFSRDRHIRKIEGLDLIYDQDREVPCLSPLNGIRQLPVLSHTLPPNNRTNAFVIGDKERFLVDPSPQDREEMEKLCQVVSLWGISGVFITHAHPDHHEFSGEIARRFKVPMKMSEKTLRRMEGGRNDFTGLSVSLMKEGDVLTTWLGENVLVFEIPGHDEGQLGLAPVSQKWFLVGDLIQGMGTVVIAAPEGDMAEYFKTLRRIIDLDPKVIIPSHGIAMGGTHRLKKTLEHRMMREGQIGELHRQGKTREEIILAVYGDLPEAVRYLGGYNIDSHLRKLREEGKV